MSDEWYYAKNGQQMGPVSTDVIARMAAAGQVQANDLVWREGMPNWAPARTVRAIFPEPPQAVAVPVQPVRRDAYQVDPEPVDEVAAAPARRRAPRYEEPEEEDWDRPRPRRRRRRGNPALLIVGISVGVLLLIGLVILGIVLLMPGNPRTFSIRAGEKKTFEITFPAGKKAEIWITSDKNTDIDIFVFDKMNRKVAQDVAFNKDCYVQFIPAQTQVFRVEVVNVNMGGMLPVGENRCTMKWSPP